MHCVTLTRIKGNMGFPQLCQGVHSVPVLLQLACTPAWLLLHAVSRLAITKNKHPTRIVLLTVLMLSPQRMALRRSQRNPNLDLDLKLLRKQSVPLPRNKPANISKSSLKPSVTMQLPVMRKTMTSSYPLLLLLHQG